MTPRSARDGEHEGGQERGVRAELLSRGLSPKRSLGQNFLADRALCEKTAEEVCAGGMRGVLEIGAGLGALTAPLLTRGCQVTAVETDAALASALRDKFADAIASGQLMLVEADAAALDWHGLLSALPRPRALAGNLPYNLSGLLLRRAVDVSGELDRAVFLLQLEVVERLCAAAGTEAYGALSVFCHAAYCARRAFVIRRGAFYPQPTVDSAVVELVPRTVPTPISDEFALLVRAAFEKRRKTLRNAWRDVSGLTQPELEGVAKAAGIDLGARGETLAVAEFQRMADALRAFRAGS